MGYNNKYNEQFWVVDEVILNTCLFNLFANWVDALLDQRQAL